MTIRTVFAGLSAGALVYAPIAAAHEQAAPPAANRAALAEWTDAARLWIEGFRQYRKIPAISAALVNGDDTVWSQGFGTTDRAGKMPATADTIYSICSISKLFTSIALMQQWEEGKVRLDEPVTTYLPWAKLAADARDSVPVTLHGLLTHSAGLPRESDYPYWTAPDFRFPTRAEVEARYASQAPLYPASTTFQYSNLGLSLAGYTVEAVTGVPYERYATDRVIAPLGLRDTRAGIPADLYGKQMAVGWGALRPDATRPEVKLFDTAGILPAAGYTSTANDLARFASWNLRVLRSGKQEVLKASTLREMQRVQFENPDGKTKWGLGYALSDVEGMRMIGHGGACPGYRTTVTFAPKVNMGAAVLMNASDNPDDETAALMQLVKARTAATAYEAPKDDPRFALSDYAGRYDGQPWRAGYALVPWAGGLVQVPLTGAPIEKEMNRLKPLGKDRFLIVTAQGEERDVVTFQRDASGKVVTSTQSSNSNRRIAPL